MIRLRRRGHFIRLVVVSMVAVIISACDSGASGPAPAAVEKQQLKVGILPIVGAAPAFLADESGFFEDEGLDVEFVTIQSSGTALPSLANGDLDIVFGNYVSFFAEQAKGAHSIKFVADGYYAKARTFMVVAPKDSKLLNTGDIAGKRVAVTITNGLADLIIKSALDAAGGRELAPPDFVEMAYTEMGAALQNHTVDAALLAEPYVTEVCLKTGAFPLFDAAAGPTRDLPISGYATSDQIVGKYPNAIAAFQRALRRGVSVADVDRARIEAAVHKYANVDEQTAALMQLVGFSSQLEARRLQRIPDLMSRFGIIGKSISADTMILPRR